MFKKQQKCNRSTESRMTNSGNEQNRFRHTERKRHTIPNETISGETVTKRMKTFLKRTTFCLLTLAGSQNCIQVIGPIYVHIVNRVMHKQFERMETNSSRLQNRIFANITTCENSAKISIFNLKFVLVSFDYFKALRFVS